MELIILKLVSKLQLLLTFCLSNHAKKRHLHIARASDQAATERFIPKFVEDTRVDFKEEKFCMHVFRDEMGITRML